jgi:hypothetical protein
MDTAILQRDGTVNPNALSNIHGDWYEWLLAITAWNFCIETEGAHLLLLVPNVRQFDISRLYNDRLHNLIVDLRQKVNDASGVQLISSNPDFVILNRDLVNEVLQEMAPITEINEDAITVIENAYDNFIGACDFEDIEGYMSVKFSLRPDRRLQIPHEGSLMKAIYTHLQTREWIIRPKGLKYYAVSASVVNADRDALSTVATHSIVSVHSVPQAAVDGLFEINSLGAAKDAFKEILIPREEEVDG